MATHYVYDDAGRLCKIYAEVVDQPHFIGGFKLSKENRYHYTSIPDLPCTCQEYDIEVP